MAEIGRKIEIGDANAIIKEYMVSKNNKTLGDLRNISLSHVPNGVIWTTWDDDDWRHETYLSVLYNELIRLNNAQKMKLPLKNEIRKQRKFDKIFELSNFYTIKNENTKQRRS